MHSFAGDVQMTNMVVARLFSASAVCAICLDEMDDILVTPCGHQFCQEVQLETITDSIHIHTFIHSFIYSCAVY